MQMFSRAVTGRPVSSPDVSACHSSRAERLPNRDLLRLFVRSSAVRQGTSSTAPWVVSPHLFVLHGLKNKIASIFLPSAERVRCVGVKAAVH